MLFKLISNKKSRNSMASRFNI